MASKKIFIRSLVGWWTGTGWSRTIDEAQAQATMLEARTKAWKMRLAGERVRVFELARKEVPLDDKQVLLGDDSVRTRDSRLPKPG